MTTEKMIIWADGDVLNGQEIELSPFDGLDVDFAAKRLGCDPSEVNFCRPGEMDAYGVTLKDDGFIRPAGLAGR